MAEINEQFAKWPYNEATLPEGRLAVSSCDPQGAVFIKLNRDLSPYVPGADPIIVNIETGITHTAEECTFRLLERGVTITLEVKK
jgi:hypothetical protein